MAPTVESRFVGCLLGLAVGDALGSHFEGRPPERIAERYRTAADLVANPPGGQWNYTDDSQMAIGLAESLIACDHVEQSHLSSTFGANYEIDRGYGSGAMAILQTIRDGGDHRALAQTLFPGGSYGNGAAMRAAPVGLAFRQDLNKAWEEGRLSALPTHVHPLGVEGAQLIAIAVALAATLAQFERSAFFGRLLEFAQCIEFAGPLRRAAAINDSRDLALFGNGFMAGDSVVTAIASFALTPDDYCATVANVIVLGGDTDTMAAMAGAISGARLGREAIPTAWLAALEDGERGRSYIAQLASELFARFGAT